MSLTTTSNNPASQPMRNAGSPKKYTPYYILQQMRKDYQNKIHNHESEFEHHGIILTVRAIPATEFSQMYNDDQWIYQTLNAQMGVDPKVKHTRGMSFYECHVYVEEYSQILPEIDVQVLQKFEGDMRTLNNPQSTKSPSKTAPNAALKKTQTKIVKAYKKDDKLLEKIKKEHAKCTFHPCCYFATNNASLQPQPWQLVQVNVQENSSDHFLGRISKIFDKRKSAPKPAPKASP